MAQPLNVERVFDLAEQSLSALYAVIRRDFQRNQENHASVHALAIGSIGGFTIEVFLKCLALIDTGAPGREAERVRAGQAIARANGKTWGGSEKGRRLKVTDEQVKTIRRMKKEGDAIAAIARATGLSRPTAYAQLGYSAGCVERLERRVGDSHGVWRRAQTASIIRRCSSRGILRCPVTY